MHKLLHNWSIHNWALHKSYSTLVRKYSTKYGVFTTPIYYVNGEPHIGHLYSTLLAEFMAKYWKMQNEDRQYILSTGTDEHGLKIQQAAAVGNNDNRNVYEYCTQMSNQFKNVFDQYKIEYTNFIRTTDENHIKVVKDIWNQLVANGDVYEGQYEGWYCVSDEAFVTNVYEKDGIVYSSDSNKICEWVVEKNYKFKLSKYIPQLKRYITPSMIIPKERFNEVYKMIERYEQHPIDLSITRSTNRVSWGIQVPNDPSQTIYVWLDALSNYLTISNYGKNNFYWPPECQILGKDILKFHTIYWISFLIALKLELPKKLLVHSHWTVDGIKMSKSLNNFIDAKSLLDSYEYDYIKFYLLHESNIENDSDFSPTKIKIIINLLADQFGNLLLRAFGKRLHKQTLIQYHSNYYSNHVELLNNLYNEIHPFYENGDVRNGIKMVLKVLRECNKLFESEEPWKMKDEERLSSLKFIVLETLRICGIAFYPFLTEKMKILFKYLNIDEEPTIHQMKFGYHGLEFHVPLDPPKLFKKY